MTNHHKIKLNINFCDAVLSGDKNFEVRCNDRGYQKGDLVSFMPVNDEGAECIHPIIDNIYKITYVLSGWGILDEFVAFGIKDDSIKAKG